MLLLFIIHHDYFFKNMFNNYRSKYYIFYIHSYNVVYA